MIFATTDYREILQSEWDRKRKLNSKYSLRAFARDIQISPSRLSEILNRHYGLSRKAAETICTKLNLSEREREIFCDQVESQHSRSLYKKKAAIDRLEKHRDADKTRNLSVENFKLASEWYHFALLELVSLRDFNSDPKWIGYKLGLEVSKVEDSIDLLIKLDLLEWQGDKLVAVSDCTYSPSEIPLDAIKNFHYQVIDNAKIALYEQEVEERYFSSAFYSIAEEDVDEFIDDLKKLRKKFSSKIIKSKKEKDQVYCLSMQFTRTSINEGEYVCVQ